MGALAFVCQGGQKKKALSLSMTYGESNKCTHFRTETKREQKSQSHGGYANTRRGVECERGGFWFASTKNISVVYNNFIVH